MEIIYPGVSWDNLRVYTREDGKKIEISDFELELEGNLSPSVVEGEEGDDSIEEFESARQDISESDEDE
jgi:hypothetical protein